MFRSHCTSRKTLGTATQQGCWWRVVCAWRSKRKKSRSPPLSAPLLGLFSSFLSNLFFFLFSFPLKPFLFNSSDPWRSLHTCRLLGRCVVKSLMSDWLHVLPSHRDSRVMCESEGEKGGCRGSFRFIGRFL